MGFGVNLIGTKIELFGQYGYFVPENLPTTKTDRRGRFNH
ncbi:hypothetical protein ADIS_3282 [Lunatimonas lonarensis]|uniref:Uncharacterized protein n=1 Tax=Lunatimonas lonarensis TaxID=1232681 RepID=R7ZQ73_9BACT|nr:hypothetical protein ADIS_3282 [Lunatimonas lonarensis]